MRLLLTAIATIGMLFAAPALAQTLYTHNFADLHDIAINGSPTVTPNVAAPGGKSGVALQFDGVSGSYVDLTPSGVVLPDDATATFRIYITDRTDFMGAYSYRPGEGLRFLPGGVLQHSNNVTLPSTWSPNTWYTVALHTPGTGLVEIYLKEGANTQLTVADLQGSTAGPSGPMTHNIFFNYGGQYYLADYAVNAGLDLTSVPEPACLSLLALGGLLVLRRRRA